MLKYSEILFVNADVGNRINWQFPEGFLMFLSRNMRKPSLNNYKRNFSSVNLSFDSAAIKPKETPD